MTVALDVATPDRSRALQLPPCSHQTAPYLGPGREKILELRRQHVNPALFTLYSEPVMLVEGHRQYVWDETGRRYLDLFAGICTVACGHSHPKIVAAVQKQMALLAHGSTAFLHPNMPRFAEALLAKLPPSLDRIYFVNSGSEANDLAIQMARLHTGNADVIGIRNAYHGGSAPTGALTGIHTWKSGVQRGGPVHHALNPDPYRNPFSGTPEQIASRSAEDVAELIRYSTPGQVAAFISEPIQGAGGVTMGAPNYLPEVYEIVRAHGGVCIADEVQTGFGRTGDNFWGFERSGVVPEIVTMAKGIGNGLPLAAPGPGRASRRHRQRPRPGTHDRRRTGRRPGSQDTGHGPGRPRARRAQGPRRHRGQGWAVRQRAPDQAAAGADGRRCRVRAGGDG